MSLVPSDGEATAYLGRREGHCQDDDSSPHAAHDRGDEHQDRYEVEDEEAPQPVRLDAFAAEDTKAGEEKLDRNSEDKQPGKPAEQPARHIHTRPPQLDRRLNSWGGYRLRRLVVGPVHFRRAARG